MRFHAAIALTAALSLPTISSGLKILMGNDDGFGSGNLRELYKALKSVGHDVIIVAPVVQNSGQGGRSVFTTYANLTTPSQYNLIPTGSPSLGRDTHDPDIWYYNGTPAACTFIGLDFVLPRFYKNWTGGPDLFVAGPNFGTNAGPYLYTLSGTMGATYSAVGRSVPGIAISASNSEVPYTNVTNSTNPATYAANVSLKVIQSFIENTANDQRILPLGYGVNVNIPPLDSSDIPPIVKSRMTGDADVDIAVYDEKKGTFTWGNASPKQAGVNAAINGDVSLPGETYVVESGSVSVSVFTVDYDAPDTWTTRTVYRKLNGIVGSGNATEQKKRGLRRLTSREANLEPQR